MLMRLADWWRRWRTKDHVELIPQQGGGFSPATQVSTADKLQSGGAVTVWNWHSDSEFKEQKTVFISSIADDLLKINDGCMKIVFYSDFSYSDNVQIYHFD